VRPVPGKDASTQASPPLVDSPDLSARIAQHWFLSVAYEQHHAAESKEEAAWPS
jgi:hypothetical protein